MIAGKTGQRRPATALQTKKPYAAVVALLPAVLGLGTGCATMKPGVRVTYVANEGFLLEAGPHKMIVDGLFRDPRIDFCDVPTEELLTRIEQGATPSATSTWHWSPTRMWIISTPRLSPGSSGTIGAASWYAPIKYAARYRTRAKILRRFVARLLYPQRALRTSPSTGSK